MQHGDFRVHTREGGTFLCGSEIDAMDNFGREVKMYSSQDDAPELKCTAFPAGDWTENTYVIAYLVGGDPIRNGIIWVSYHGEL